MPPQALPARIRLAELLAALSLGIDLGFGQPMEHVLRQCLICHSDAHEQARWFGNDIALKAAKYRHGMRARGAAASMTMLGAEPAPLHRFRLGLEFMIAGHRQMDIAV